MMASWPKRPLRFDRGTIDRARERVEEARDRVLEAGAAAADGSASSAGSGDSRDPSSSFRPISVISSSLSLDWLCSSLCSEAVSGGKGSFSGSRDEAVIVWDFCWPSRRRGFEDGKQDGNCGSQASSCWALRRQKGYFQLSRPTTEQPRKKNPLEDGEGRTK